MKTIPKNYDKAYIGDKELRTENSNIGSEVLNLYHRPPIFRMIGTYEIGDAAFYDTKHELIKVAPPSEFEYINPDRYKPIGVVLVPSYINLYGTGEAAILSLNYLSRTNPETGDVSINSNNALSMIGNYPSSSGKEEGYYPADGPLKWIINWAPTIGRTEGGGLIEVLDFTEGHAFSHYKWFSIIPTNRKVCTIIKQPEEDLNVQYRVCSTGLPYYLLPSPLLTDGTLNPKLFNTEELNVFSNIDGKEKTYYLVELADKVVPGWRDLDLIPKTAADAGSVYFSPACCAASKYHTLGTNPGDWYIPCMAEIHFYTSRNLEFDVGWKQLNKVFGDTFYSNYIYPSISASSANLGLSMYDTGSIGCGGTSLSGAIKAITKIR